MLFGCLGVWGVWVFGCLGVWVFGCLNFEGFVQGSGFREERKIWMKLFLDESVVDEIVNCFG